MTIQANTEQENIRNFSAENAERLSELNVVGGVAQYWVGQLKEWPGKNIYWDTWQKNAFISVHT